MLYKDYSSSAVRARLLGTDGANKTFSAHTLHSRRGRFLFLFLLLRQKRRTLLQSCGLFLASPLTSRLCRIVNAYRRLCQEPAGSTMRNLDVLFHGCLSCQGNQGSHHEYDSRPASTCPSWRAILSEINPPWSLDSMAFGSAICEFRGPEMDPKS